MSSFCFGTFRTLSSDGVVCVFAIRGEELLQVGTLLLGLASTFMFASLAPTQCGYF